MAQGTLFLERIEDALASVINECGGRKKFASEMWPGKPQRDAHNLLDACLNPERREKFAPHDVLYILKRGREAGCHTGVSYICEQAGYTTPAPVDPEDELSAMLREYLDIERRRNALAPRIEEARLKVAK